MVYPRIAFLSSVGPRVCRVAVLGITLALTPMARVAAQRARAEQPTIVPGEARLTIVQTPSTDVALTSGVAMAFWCHCCSSHLEHVSASS